MNKVIVKDIMIRNIHTIRPEAKIALARLKMLRYGVGALPVVDDNDVLVGILTLRDIDLAGELTNDLFAEDLMSTNLITKSESTSIIEIAKTMSESSIQRIPIIDKNGKLVGLVTQSVIIRSLITDTTH